MTAKIGFIGLGMMGHGMARNILNKGFGLAVMAHRNREAVDALVGQGATEAATPKALATACDMVFLCVSGSPQVEQIVYGEDGILAAARPGFTLIDCTTSDPTSTRHIATDLEKFGAHMADAPVTRGPADAEAGRLNSMVGASPETFETIRPVIDAYSENVVYFGGVGAGHTAKLINNFVTTGTCALIAEGMAAAAAMGVDQRALFDVMSNGAANSGSLQKMVPKFLEGDLTGHAFAIQNAHKDVSYYGQMATAIGLEPSLGLAVAKSYQKAMDLGLGERLMPSLMEMYEKTGGFNVVPRTKR